MRASGYVLAGGRSTRMGRDKALLPLAGTTLAGHVARAVLEAAGAVSLIGDPAKYGHLGFPVHPDKQPGCGPLGGLYTALAVSRSEWSFVAACDLPGISAPVLRTLLDRALESGRHCAAAAGPGGSPEPLCAVYHQSCLPIVERALREKRLKMRDLAVSLDVLAIPVAASVLANVNTPDEWAQFEEALK